MNYGNYLYGITNNITKSLDTDGLLDEKIQEINHKDLVALTSRIPFKEIEPNIENISIHQKVIDKARKDRAIIPVRFGVILKEKEGVIKLLQSSYNEFKEKLGRFSDSDEFGVKISLKQDAFEKMKISVTEESDEVNDLKKEISVSKEGKAYFLNLKLNESIKNKTYHKIDEKTISIHNELAKYAIDVRRLNENISQIILNSSFLVKRSKADEFTKKAEQLKQECKKYGFAFHLSGPWAPYSFC